MVDCSPLFLSKITLLQQQCNEFSYIHNNTVSIVCGYNNNNNSKGKDEQRYRQSMPDTVCGSRRVHTPSFDSVPKEVKPTGEVGGEVLERPFTKIGLRIFEDCQAEKIESRENFLLYTTGNDAKPIYFVVCLLLFCLLLFQSVAHHQLSLTLLN